MTKFEIEEKIVSMLKTVSKRVRPGTDLQDRCSDQGEALST